jgi:stress-induced morphogen
VHITITAPAFNELTETQKQQLVWDVLRQDLGEDALGISFVLPYGVEHAA